MEGREGVFNNAFEHKAGSSAREVATNLRLVDEFIAIGEHACECIELAV